MQPHWSGVFPAVTTQFHEDQALDLEGTERHLVALIESGVRGLIMCGSLGENQALDPAETRRRYHGVVVEQANELAASMEQCFLAHVLDAQVRRRAQDLHADAPFEPRVTGRRRTGRSVHTFVFRSRELILESDEADLVRDVRLDPDKARKKLTAIRRRLQGVQEWAAAQVQELTAADTKLSAAIVAALLSRQR